MRVLASSPPKYFLKINNQYFSVNFRTVYFERYGILLNLSPTDVFLAILEGLISKNFFGVRAPMSLNLILSPPRFNFVAPSL